MKISSTEFQQNVGYYLKEAETGKEIFIQKSKPYKVLFKVIVAPQKKNTEKKKASRYEFISRLIKAANIRTKQTGLDFQQRVRE